MWRQNGKLKPQRGKTLPLDVQPNWSSEQLLTAAVKKVKDFNQDMQDERYVLLYPDGAEVKHIPGTNTPFRIQLYKEALGKAYQRVTLFICTVQDFGKQILIIPTKATHLPQYIQKLVKIKANNYCCCCCF